MAEQVFVLNKAELSLFHSNAQGDAADGDALFIGACAAGLKIGYRFDEVETRPSGVPYPNTHHVNESHSIEIERIWIVNGEEFQMERNRNYILKIKWVDPDDGSKYFQRSYYGVKNQSADMGSQDVQEFLQN